MKKTILFTALICSATLLHSQWLPPLILNTSYGTGALSSNTTGTNNAAFGHYTLNANTTGSYNTAVGGYALYKSNSTSNVAVGRMAAYNTTTGGSNTVVGTRAMENNTTGFANVAVGTEALRNNVSGYWNTAVGQSAGPVFGGTAFYNATAIGYYAISTGNAQVRIGNEFVTDIGGQVEWSALSDARFKRDIREDIAGLDFINKLRPVSYIVDEDALARSHRMPDSVRAQLQAVRKPAERKTGFVAQEVEAIVKKGQYSFDAVVAPQNENDRYSIRYAAFVVPLVKAVQELSAEVQEQRQQIQSLLSQLDSKNVSAGNTQAVLLQNNPNPFDAETEIRMMLPDNVGMASVMIYNLEGKQMRSIQVAARGDVSVKLSASELAAGMYLYALIADGKVMDTKRMVLTK